MVLEPWDLQRPIHDDILVASGSYEAVDAQAIPWATIFGEYVKLVNRIATYHGHKFHGARRAEVVDTYRKALSKSLYAEGTSRTSRLITTCKTHKDPGQVSHRNVHSCPCSCFAGLSGWLRKVLADRLIEIRFILRSVQGFVDMVSHSPVNDSDRLIRLDAKHFFMSGTAEDLAEYACLLIENDQPLRNLVRDAIYYLCYWQYLRSDEYEPDVLWQVREGSGMGLGHSGPIASASLWARSERDHAGVPSIQNSYCVSHYCRYMDDIFFVGVDGRWVQYAQVLKARAGHFKFDDVIVSKSEVEMLSVRVFKRDGHLHTTPRIRFVGPPLAWSSCHSIASRRWPIVMVHSLAKMTTDRRDLPGELYKFQQRLEPRPGIVYSSSIIADGKWFCVSQHNGTYVMDAKPAFKLLSHNAFSKESNRTNACPIVHNNQLLIRSDKFLYCIGN